MNENYVRKKSFFFFLRSLRPYSASGFWSILCCSRDKSCPTDHERLIFVVIFTREGNCTVTITISAFFFSWLIRTQNCEISMQAWEIIAYSQCSEDVNCFNSWKKKLNVMIKEKILTSNNSLNLGGLWIGMTKMSCKVNNDALLSFSQPYLKMNQWIFFFSNTRWAWYHLLFQTLKKEDFSLLLHKFVKHD